MIMINAMREKFRVVKRYHPDFGGWFAIQKKNLFGRWTELPKIYKTLDDAIKSLANDKEYAKKDPMQTIETTIDI